MLDRLLETRRTHRKAPLPRPAIAVEAGYRIQDELREALVARGERVIGWKAGLTGRVAQESLGIHHPVSGFLLGDGVYATGETVPLSRFAELAVEVEIAFVMKRDLAGPGVTPAAALLGGGGRPPRARAGGVSAGKAIPPRATWSRTAWPATRSRSASP